ncbi:MAG: Gldg family protein [Planctomycetes bacterium]|nr:Gldg family protein [Planctomycetota bacterium]
MTIQSSAFEKRRARRARLATLAQVALAALLALAAVLLITWLSERRGFRARFDLTRSAENTLDPVSVSVIEKLPVEIAIDVFFRGADPPLSGEVAKAQNRMRKLLRRAADESGGRIVIEDHDLSNVARLPARAQARMGELKITALEPGGMLVVSAGTRRELVRLRPDIADLDPGQPGGPGVHYQPPRTVSFRGEEALMSALLKVSLATTKKVVFTQGHGEPDLVSVDHYGLSLLKGELEGDGFEVVTWDGARAGPLPADCDVLVVLGPEQVLTSAESADVRKFVDAGGRLIAAPGVRPLAGEGSLAALLADYGVRLLARGVVAYPLPATAGGAPHYGLEECGDLAIGFEGMPALNPITEPLRRSGRRVLMRGAHVLERAESDGATPVSVRDLLRSPEDSWHELPLPGTEDRFDWKPENDSERGRFLVALQASFSPRAKPPERANDDGRSRPESRIVVIGSKDSFQNYLLPSNRDFILNCFNWAGSREYRVKVSKTNPEARRIDVKSEGSLARVTWIALFGLPLISAVLGIATVWRRNRR